jgi:hypothetical protein
MTIATSTPQVKPHRDNGRFPDPATEWLYLSAALLFTGTARRGHCRVAIATLAAKQVLGKFLSASFSEDGRCLLNLFSSLPFIDCSHELPLSG